ncbi:hypothetical protein [Marmoricola sp. Leaf446]|uniref:hypothetical protein n=1 Tax=Marmoricola sp. Leaf446 TaxID=1736379 RepID=UPI001F31F9CD|nr:hypothetical protein [Marmoricola sp. Leaf446]
MDPYDVRLEDDELLSEVELTASLIVAANQTDAHLTPHEIDQALGIPRQGHAAPGS